MGQRHMTYVVAEIEGLSKSLHVSCLYNQWNFETIQPQKVVRFLKALKGWEKSGDMVDAQSVCELYHHIASIVPSGGVSRYHCELEHYTQNYGMHDEDNNNGWQIVYITRARGQKKFKVSVGFKPGHEWGDGSQPEAYMALKTYLDGHLTHRDGREGKDFLDFIAKGGFSKAEQKALLQISASFNKGLIEYAEKLIAAEINSARSRKGRARA